MVRQLIGGHWELFSLKC